MSDLKERVRRLVKIMFCLLALFVLGLTLTEYRAVFWSLILGASVSLVNAVYTAIKVDQVGKRIAAGRKPGGVGMLTRFSMVALAILIAFRYSETFHIPSLAIGLVLSTVVLYLDELVNAYLFRNTKVERGEE